MTLRRIGICVDDFGMHRGINAAAIELAEAGVVSAISCMPLHSAWEDGALKLRGMPAERVDVGLHLDIALGDGKTEPPLRKVHLATYSGKVDAADVRTQISRQFDAFEQHMGRLPAYVDGHRHVHQLPVVRDALLQEVEARYSQQADKPWVRSTSASRLAPKALIIRLLGGRAFDAAARQHGLRTSGRLLGVYGFDPDPAACWMRLRGWLERSRTGDVLMSHPSRLVMDGDAISPARMTEFAVLRSPHFATTLQQLKISVEPPSRFL